MPRLLSLPRVSVLAFLLWLGSAQASATVDVCSGGKPRERMVAFLSMRIDRPGAGLALDDALKAERDAASALRFTAERHFLESPGPRLRGLRERFTFLFPPKVEEFYDLGVPVALSPSALALRYRDLLWKHYIERFTTVEEAPGRDPYSIRFKVSLDLRLFCRYRQEVRDLIAR